mmetsp:Transcript_12924/g.30222  ORF Transcript_12924/g.30222 Transcript_12924/m.30222 type:complete len:224 (+) Transcript_12924:493-1164(+)
MSSCVSTSASSSLTSMWMPMRCQISSDSMLSHPTQIPCTWSKCKKASPVAFRFSRMTVAGAPVLEAVRNTARSSGLLWHSWVIKRQLLPQATALEKPVISSNPSDTIFREWVLSKGSAKDTAKSMLAIVEHSCLSTYSLSPSLNWVSVVDALENESVAGLRSSKSSSQPSLFAARCSTLLVFRTPATFKLVNIIARRDQVCPTRNHAVGIKKEHLVMVSCEIA